MNSTSQKRLLVMKLGAIGDVVMVIPAAYAMYRRGYSVDWICGEAVAPILQNYAWLNVIAIDERKLVRGPLMERLQIIGAMWRRLARRPYDVCATLYYDQRYAVLTWPVRARRRVRLSRKDRATELLPGRHHTDEFARILLGDEDGEVPQQLAPIKIEGLPPSPLKSHVQVRVVLVPGGAKNFLRDDALRRWPLESYVALARDLRARGYEVVLAGGPDDLWTAAAFKGIDVVDAIGKLSLLETLSLLDSADVTVTHDTGPLHLAGITSTAIVSIFGPTDPHGRLPQRENCVALWGGEGFACRPCYDGSTYAPCTHNGCVEQVTPQMVLAEVDRLIEARRSGRTLPPRVILPEHTPVSLVKVEMPR